MRTIRVHVELPLLPGELVALPDGAAEHAVRVLRLREGDPITLFNGDGHDYPGRLEYTDRRHAQVRLTDRVSVLSESSLRLTLVQAIARGEKMDWIVQKATELGVCRIVPVHTERSEVKLDERRAAKRLTHWQAVVTAACEQSGRATVPTIDPPQSLDHCVHGDGIDVAPRLALLPESGQRPRDLDLSTGAATLAVGPEGGWGERDMSVLRAAGFTALNLGPRVLRTETAGLAALAALQALHGDF